MGGGNGRVYTIVLEASDVHGQRTTAIAQVLVPRSCAPGSTTTDDGHAYGVVSACY